MTRRQPNRSHKSASFRPASKQLKVIPKPDLAQALRLHQSGQIDQAEKAYDQLRVDSPHDPQLLYLKGVARQQRGDHTLAIQFLRRAAEQLAQNGSVRFTLSQSYWALHQPEEAIEELRAAIMAEPHQVSFRHLLAEYLLAAGRDQQTVEALEGLVAVNPAYGQAWTLLGNAKWKLGAHSEAAQHYRRALEQGVRDASVYASLGSVLIRLDELEDAAAALRQAIQLQPTFSAAHNNLGNALRQLMQIEEALEHFDRAIELEPKNAVYLDNRGLAFQGAERWDEAESSFRRAVTVDANCYLARLHLALLHHSHRRTPEALEQFQLAARLAPGDAAPINGIASCLYDQHRFCEARPFYEQALRLAPKSVATWENLADCACEQGDLTLGANCFDRANELDPNTRYEVKKALRLSPILDSREAMLQRREEMRRDLTDILQSAGRLASAVHEIRSASFYLAYHGENERHMLSLLGDFYTQADPSLNFVAPHCRSAQPTRRKLRVGFLSRYFCNHSVGLHFGGLIREMNHDDFETFVLRVSYPDDDVARSIVSAADVKVDLSPQFERARQQVSECELDVLIYTDLGMDFFTYFLAFARLARVQCVLAGHPITSGIPNVDYFISNDQLEPPDAATHYREQLVRLRGRMTRLERPTGIARSDRQLWGFKPDDHLYVCPQTLFKMHPDFDCVLAQILERDPAGKLVLFRADSADWSQLLTDRFRRTMPNVVDSVRWLDRMPMADFLAFLSCCDVVLDTLHFNGGTTSMLALGAGVPIVTLPGPYMRGRTTRVCYDWMGLSKLIANDQAQYVELANAVAYNPDFRDTCAREIDATRDELFHADSVIRELEQTLLELSARS